MTRGISYLLLTVLLAGAVIVSDAQTSALAKAERVTGDRFTIRVRTPAGANVYAVRQPSEKMLEAIDGGLADLAAVARKNGYRRMLSPSNYTIFIARADRDKTSDGVYSPDIAVGAAQYAGSVYDQGGYIYAAGMVISTNPMSFAIAEHTKDFNRVRDVVRTEGEHLVIYRNDRQGFRQDLGHGTGGSHPILQ